MAGSNLVAQADQFLSEFQKATSREGTIGQCQRLGELFLKDLPVKLVPVLANQRRQLDSILSRWSAILQAESQRAFAVALSNCLALVQMAPLKDVRGKYEELWSKNFDAALTDAPGNADFEAAKTLLGGVPPEFRSMPSFVAGSNVLAQADQYLREFQKATSREGTIDLCKRLEDDLQNQMDPRLGPALASQRQQLTNILSGWNAIVQADSSRAYALALANCKRLLQEAPLTDVRSKYAELWSRRIADAVSSSGSFEKCSACRDELKLVENSEYYTELLKRRAAELERVCNLKTQVSNLTRAERFEEALQEIDEVARIATFPDIADVKTEVTNLRKAASAGQVLQRLAGAWAKHDWVALQSTLNDARTPARASAGLAAQIATYQTALSNYLKLRGALVGRTFTDADRIAPLAEDLKSLSASDQTLTNLANLSSFYQGTKDPKSSALVEQKKRDLSLELLKRDAGRALQLALTARAQNDFGKLAPLLEVLTNVVAIAFDAGDAATVWRLQNENAIYQRASNEENEGRRQYRQSKRREDYETAASLLAQARTHYDQLNLGEKSSALSALVADCNERIREIEVQQIAQERAALRQRLGGLENEIRNMKSLTKPEAENVRWRLADLEGSMDRAFRGQPEFEALKKRIEHANKSISSKEARPKVSQPPGPP